MKSVKDAVLEWQYMLQSIAKKPENWKMNYIEISKKDSIVYDYSKCDITINFKRQFDQPVSEGYGNILGIMMPQGDGNSIIELYFQEFSTCTKSDTYFQHIYYCYYDDVIPATAIGLTARHEVGHALGLGHYLSDDPDENMRWGTIVSIAPSIMVQFDNQVKDFKKIQERDIYKIKEIYGEKGFGTIIKQPEPIEVSKPTISDKVVVSIGPRETKTINLTGNVPEKYYKRGTPLAITLTMPDGSRSTSAIHVTSTQYFEYPMMFSYNSMEGQYTITTEFEGHEVKKFSIYLSKSTGTTNPIHVPSNVVSSNVVKMHDKSNSSTLQIPQWIKNNAKWYADDIISEEDFKKGIEFLIKNNIIEVPVLDKNNTNNNQKIPQWIKNNAKWWSANQIPDDDFLKGIKYLIENGIIQI